MNKKSKKRKLSLDELILFLPLPWRHPTSQLKKKKKTTQTPKQETNQKSYVSQIRVTTRAACLQSSGQTYANSSKPGNPAAEIHFCQKSCRCNREIAARINKSSRDARHASHYIFCHLPPFSSRPIKMIQRKMRELIRKKSLL